MIDQGMGGDIVYIVSKNAVFAGPNNVAYGAAKADQAHQVRLLAAELGEHGIRVNGVNPDGVVRGSGIFAKGWGADRARTYGVAGGQARRVLRAADAAQARGAARARGRGGVRPDRRRPEPDDRAARPGRRRRRRRVPAVTGGGRSRAVDLGASSGRVIVGRVGPRHARARRGPPLPQRAGRRCRTACTGTCAALVARSSTGLRAAGRAAAGDLAGIGVDSWGVDYGLLDADGALLGDPFHYRDARGPSGGRRGPRRHPARAPVRSGPACSSCRSTRSTSSRPSAAAGAARRPNACC